MALGIELRKWRETGAGAAVTIRTIKPRQMNSRRGNIGGAKFEIVKIVIDAGGPASYVAVAKVFRNAIDAEQLNVPRRQRIQVVLEAHVIKHRVGRDVLASSCRKDRLSLNVVSSRQRQWYELVPETDWLSRLSINRRRKNVWNRRRQRVVLPQVRNQSRDRSPGM